LGLLTTFLVSYLKTKTQEVKETSQNELVSKYVDMLNDTITNCVIATNQTYVDALKKEGKFDTDAQKEAFNLTYQAVMNILTEDA
jgi:predicted ATPase